MSYQSSPVLNPSICVFALIVWLQIDGPEPYRAGFVVTKTSTDSSAQEELEVNRIPPLSRDLSPSHFSIAAAASAMFRTI